MANMKHVPPTTPVSASLMHVLIAQLSGVTDVYLLFCIFGLTAITMAFGWMMELLNAFALPTWQLGPTPADAPTLCEADHPNGAWTEAGMPTAPKGPRPT